MSFAFTLPDACRAAEAALAQLTANLVAKNRAQQTVCKLTPDDLDYLRGRINAIRLRLEADAYLRELWPAPHVAIGVKNNVPLQYAEGVLLNIAAELDTLGADRPPDSFERMRLADMSKALTAVREILEDALPLHLRRQRMPGSVPDAIGAPDAITVAEIIARYLDDMLRRAERGDISMDHAKIVRLELLRFGEAFGAVKVADLKQHDLSAWIEQNPQWVAIHTRTRVSDQIISCFKWAAEEDYIVKCPFRRPRAIRGFTPAVRRPAERREYVILCWKGSRELRLALFFIRRSGARTSEMRTMRWDDLRLDDDPPHVYLTEHKTARQSGKPRIIPLDSTMVRVLRAMKRRAERRCKLTGKEFVFVNADGTPWDRHSFARHLRRTAKRIGLDKDIVSRISAYMLRHLFAVEALEAGIGIRQVADVLGHAKLDTISQFYGSHCRFRAKHLGNVADQIDEARRKKKKPSN